MKRIAAFLGFLLFAAAAQAQTMCAPIGAVNGEGQSVDLPSGLVIVLNSRGCANVFNAEDRASLQAQGFTLYSLPQATLAFDNHADLLAGLGPLPATVTQNGYYAAGDGGAATYVWNAASTAPSDQVGVLVPAGYPGGLAGRYIYQPVNNVLPVAAFGMKADDATNNSPFWQDIVNFQTLGVTAPGGAGYDVKFGCNATYYFSSPIELHQQMTVEGCSTEAISATPTTTLLHFADNIAGIVVNASFDCWQYGYDVVNCPAGDASGSVIRNLVLGPKSWPSALTVQPLMPKANGVWMRSRARLENLYVYGFANDCINGYAQSGAGAGNKDINGNANGWIVVNSYEKFCYGDGVRVGGPDGNAGYSMGNNTLQNDMFGLQDEATPGGANTEIVPQSSGDGTFDLGAFGGIGPTITTVTYGGFQYKILQTGYTADYTTGTGHIALAQVTPPSGAATTNSAWEYYLTGGPDLNIATWGQVIENNQIYTVIPGHESVMWQNDPATHSSVWSSNGYSPGWILRMNGTPTTGEQISLLFTSSALTGSPVTFTVSEGTGSTLTQVATAMANAMNANASLIAAGVTAVAVDSHIQVYQPNSLSPQATFSFSTNGGTHMSASIYEMAYISWDPAYKMATGVAPYLDDNGSRTQFGPYVLGGSYRSSISDTLWLTPYEEGSSSYSRGHFWTGFPLGGNVSTTPEGKGYHLGTAPSIGQTAGGNAAQRSETHTGGVQAPYFQGQFYSGTTNNTDGFGVLSILTPNTSAVYTFVGPQPVSASFTGYARAPNCFVMDTTSHVPAASWTATGTTLTINVSSTNHGVQWTCWFQT